MWTQLNEHTRHLENILKMVDGSGTTDRRGREWVRVTRLTTPQYGAHLTSLILGAIHWVLGVGSYLKEVSVPSSHTLIVSLYPVLPKITPLIAITT
jgi:hypothetical protein